MTKEYIGIKCVQAWPEDKDGKPGYAVKYDGGYMSWSPKEVFEKAYLCLGHEREISLDLAEAVYFKVELDMQGTKDMLDFMLAWAKDGAPKLTE